MLNEHKINFQKIVTVIGRPGLYYLKSYNLKGFFVESFENGHVRFISNAKNRVLALGNIDIATIDGSISLLEVFQRMESLQNMFPVEEQNEDSYVGYFEKIVPNYDRKKVYSGSIHKILQWYLFIRDHVVTEFQSAINEEDEKLSIV
jgi:hypothetical protein